MQKEAKSTFPVLRICVFISLIKLTVGQVFLRKSKLYPLPSR